MMSEVLGSSSNTVVPNNDWSELSADPPFPPNWNTHFDDTLQSLVPYKAFPIAADTLEYATIVELMNPFQIGAVEQIVNPTLWNRFVNTRRDMLLSKSDDLRLLTKLSSDERNILQHTHNALNYDKHDQVAAFPYDDNVALLFHCTRSKKNVDTILLQGLDERVGNGGNLGRGIYFASDPAKSIEYDGCRGTIFIFMVILGDCLTVQTNSTFVREPDKHKDQRRNFSDISFDSIVGQPAGACEYVIYNRYQCCPLYKISYSRAVAGTGVVNGIYSQWKSQLPPLSWTATNGSMAMPPVTSNSDWPFFAKTIFSKMGVPQPQPMDIDMLSAEMQIEESAESIESKMTVLTSLGFTDPEINFETLRNSSFNLDRTINKLLEQNDSTTINESEILINNKLATLSSMGFTNGELNEEILKKNSYDLNKSVNELMERFEQDAGPSHIDYGSESPLATNGSNGAIINVADDVKDSQFKECTICSDIWDESIANWKALQCGHEICSQCHQHIETTRTTMSGITFTFTKCPFCMKTSGTQVGMCPDGTMTTSVVTTPCEGYEKYQSIRIQYDVKSDAYQLHRIAYLPNSDEGNQLLELLRIAWDRRICFTIGTSATDNRDDVLVWNIHHKTAQNGGVKSHGFPDEKYMERCRLELRAFGIE